MKSAPDLQVFVSWPSFFVDPRSRKDNNRELITANNKEFYVKACIFILV